MQMSSFRNPNTFDRELNFGSTAVRRYSISVNANTLDKLLSRLTDEVHIPEQEEEILRAVSIVGRNTEKILQEIMRCSGILVLEDSRCGV